MLERRGLVERRRNPDDRRAYSLHATPSARGVLQQATEAARRAENEFLAPIPASERRRLKQLLQRLISP